MYIKHIFKRYKQQIEDNRIYDPIRKKFVALTPEERVRQQTLKFMLQRLRVPANKIGVERSLNSLGDVGNRKRVDICVFGPNEEILAVIECKADQVGNWESPYCQAIDYVESLKVQNYFVVDGWEINGYHYNYERGQFDPVEAVPTYEEMLSMSE